MKPRRKITVDGNEACASVAHRLNEIIAIYPITPSSSMGELSDEWSAKGRVNVFGIVPDVIEMQSEAGAIGAVHGALQTGALATTFTSSQGLLLMIPDMYKIAGELTPFAMHVAARAVATHALSIFGDHSDVMACRQTGFAMLCSDTVQEAHDLALIAHASTLLARVPFMHFFDGFRTSHEITRIEELTDDDLRSMIDETAVLAHRCRGLSPDHPVVRGTAQNPDTFFQAREACSPWHASTPGIVEAAMRRFAALTGRSYGLFEYSGHPEAERIVVIMGSGAVTAAEAVKALVARGEKVGVVNVRLYRPFDVARFVAALPKTTRRIAVLDRTKEAGSSGEPLYLDVVAAVAESADSGRFQAIPEVFGGRYGLSSKEFTPAMVEAALDNLEAPRPKRHFTVGIMDDVSGSSLPVGAPLDVESADTVRAVFYGLGADGTVGANKNTIKIIGEETSNEVQAYFVYDSKKSGAMTISHLRFGPHPIRAPWLVTSAGFVGCHQFSFAAHHDILACASRGATLLLNAPLRPEQVWDHLAASLRRQIVEKEIRLFVIDAPKVARENGLGGRINTIMQICFFAITQVIPIDQAVAATKRSIEKTYQKRGPDVVRQNIAAVDAALLALREVAVPRECREEPAAEPPPVHDGKGPPALTAALLANKGDLLPVSAFPVDGTWPVGTSRFEKRNLADELPVWDRELCIQCNKCVLFCPHAAIRAKVCAPAAFEQAPEGFKSTPYRGPEYAGLSYTLQVAPEDCTGCEVCVEVCPAHDKSDPARRALAMQPQAPLREAERENFEFFLELPDLPRERVARVDAKGSQFFQPLFEFSGACAGCGETPYVKLLTELFGDRLMIANATGCSSIYGGNLPTTPFTVDAEGCGPAWANSLFEDNAEFGLGFRLAVDVQARAARALVRELAATIGEGLAEELLAEVRGEAAIAAQRRRVELLRQRLARCDAPSARRLEAFCEHLVPRSVWLVGGDGWAYDIGFGGLDHVLSSGRKVNVLVLDTEVYSNTGGQQSKATPLAASARFATAGKATLKKDLGLMAMTHGDVYVASVALGSKDSQTVRALLEAEEYPGPSLVIAYSPCIAHGYDMMAGPEHQKMMVQSGLWTLYRYDPRRAETGEPPLQLDSPAPSRSVLDLMRAESRYAAVESADPERFQRLAELASRHAARRSAFYRQLAEIRPG